MKHKSFYALALSATLLSPTLNLFAADTEAGFTKIFNGKDLTGWTGNPDLWSVKDGAIVGQTTLEHPAKGNTFLIWTNGGTADFELRLAYKITPNNDKGFGNSGMQYRSKIVDTNNWVVGGYQADFEAGSTYSGILYDEKGVAGGRGIMAARGEKVVWDADCKKQVTGSLGKSEDIQAKIKKDDWNEYVVIVRGNHFQHFINGLPTVDVTDDCTAKRLMSGVLALQLHAGQPMTVQFKDIRIKTLSGNSAAAAGEIKKLQGVWEITSMQANGAPIPAEDFAGITVTIRENGYEVVKNTNIDHGTWSVDPTRSPKEMDILPETGPGAGGMLPAIYELTADTLRISYGLQGPERPKLFVTEKDAGGLVISYKRKKL